MTPPSLGNGQQQGVWNTPSEFEPEGNTQGVWNTQPQNASSTAAGPLDGPTPTSSANVSLDQVNSLLDRRFQQFMEALLPRLNPTHAPPVSTSSTVTTGSTASSSSVNITAELIKQIPFFDGTGGPHKLSEFLRKCDNFVKAAGTNEESQSLILVTGKLTGIADAWWQEFSRRHIHITWDQLRSALHNQFTPLEHGLTLRARLWRLRQDTLSVAEYTEAFRQLHLQIPEMGEQDAISAYLNGLHPHIQQLVRADINNLKTLFAAQSAACRLAPFRYNRQASKSDSALISKDHKNKASNKASSDSHRKGNKKKDWSTYKCPLCEKTGHGAAKCPELSKAKKAIGSPTSDGDRALISVSKPEDLLIIDSGCTRHMFKDLAWLSESKSHVTGVTVGNHEVMKSTQIGSATIFSPSTGESIHLREVLCVPGLTNNLLSVRALANDGYHISFVGTSEDSKVRISSPTGEILMFGRLNSGLYCLDAEVISDRALITVTKSDYSLWHLRLGHPGRGAMSHVSQACSGAPSNLEDIPNGKCQACETAKAHRLPFSQTHNKAKNPLERIVSDYWSRGRGVESLGGATGYISFIDDFSNYVEVSLTDTKSAALECFREYCARMENQLGLTVKIFRSDGGTEYVNQDFQWVFKDKGIIHEVTPPYTPQLNGKAERMNRTLLDKTRAIMHHGGVPTELWGEILQTAVYLHNRTPTRVNGKWMTPYEAFFGKPAKVDHLRIPWSRAFTFQKHNDKLAPRSFLGRLVGYEHNSTYRIWDPESGRVIRSRHVVFDEGDAITPQDENYDPLPIEEGDWGSEDLSPTIIDQKQADEGTEYLIKWPGDGELLWVLQSDISDPTVMDEWEGTSDFHDAALTAKETPVCQEPRSYEEALNSPDSDKWKEAIRKELDSHRENNTWTIVPKPHNRSLIGCKWVFKIKRKADGSIDKYKARLVAQGFSQRPGIDYNETYSPVCRLETLRLVLTVAIILGLQIHQIDIVTAFLCAELMELLFMMIPLGISAPEGSCCQLNKTIYGLKQAQRVFNKKVNKKLRKMGFVPLVSDNGVYIRVVNGQISIIVIYVDDMLIMTEKDSEMEAIKAGLAEEFRTTDCGEAAFFSWDEIDQK